MLILGTEILINTVGDPESGYRFAFTDQCPYPLMKSHFLLYVKPQRWVPSNCSTLSGCQNVLVCFVVFP